MPHHEPFQTTLQDATAGEVRITGLLAGRADADTLVVLIHGLGGSAVSPYVRTAARAAASAGWAALCLNMRGADGSGEDIFHGGLTADIRAALASPRLAHYKRVTLLGFSVGGHLALKAALDGVDSRLAAVAAICPPLDLDAATIAFDHPSRRVYRSHVFAGLNRTYVLAACRRRFLTPASVVRQARSCRERDSLTVVPRFGFRNVEDYYERESVLARIHQLAIPSLVVAATHDPIIPAGSLRPAIGRASGALMVRWINNGGHVYFPSRLDLGFGGQSGLESQILRWLGRNSL